MKYRKMVAVMQQTSWRFEVVKSNDLSAGRFNLPFGMNDSRAMKSFYDVRNVREENVQADRNDYTVMAVNEPSTRFRTTDRIIMYVRCGSTGKWVPTVSRDVFKLCHSQSPRSRVY